MNISSPQAQAFLVCRNGPLEGESFQIGESGMRIGSGPNNDIVIRDQSILLHHASLFWHQGKLALQSLNAQASVTVNESLISPQGVYLNFGDKIGLGQSGIVFQLITSSNISGSHAATPPARSATSNYDVGTATFKPVDSSTSTSPKQATSPGAGPAHADTETTRYLCMAARIDQEFRDYVFSKIVREKHRAIGESHGVDIVAVVKSCNAAQQKVFIRDVILCVLLIIPLLLFINTTNNAISSQLPLILLPFSLILSAFGALVRLGFVALFVLLAQIKKIPTIIRVILALIAILFLLPSFSFIFLYVAAWGVVVWNLWDMYYGAETQRLTKDKFDPRNNQSPLDSQTELQLRMLSDPEQNVIVYSGFSPFVGSGFNLDGWSFTIDARKGKQKAGETLEPGTFQVGELYDCVDKAIRDLKLGQRNSKIKFDAINKIYVNGKEISNYQELFDFNRRYPKTKVDNGVVEQWKNDFSEDVRYYKCFRVTSWQGELIVSIFVRFMLIEKNLFIEANYMILPPLREVYYLLDTLEPTFTLEKLWDLARPSFFSTFSLWFLSPLHVIAYLARDWSARREKAQTERLIASNPAFDYGASASLREIASFSNYRLYFQKLDEVMYVKIIQRQLLESIFNFLDSKNIDTTDLKARQETILNHGVIVSGGSFTGNFAIGGGQVKVTSDRSTEPARNAQGMSSQQASKN